MARANDKLEVCCLCSCKYDNDPHQYIYGTIVSIPEYLNFPTELTSADCLIEIEDKLYCDVCWEDNVHPMQRIKNNIMRKCFSLIQFAKYEQYPPFDIKKDNELILAHSDEDHSTRDTSC